MSRHNYSFSMSLLARIGFSLLVGRKRSLERDALTALNTIRPIPYALDEHLIPNDGSFIIVSNHFQRKGLWIGWGALLIAKTVVSQRPDLAGSFHWVVTAEWPMIRQGGTTISNPFYQWVFRRVSRTYGLIRLAPDSRAKASRATSMRWVVSALHRAASDNKPIAIGIFPEGRTEPGLIKPPDGVASFLALINSPGTPIVPVGLAEIDGTLVARFGKPFHLQLSNSGDKLADDRIAAEEVMCRIGTLVPQQLWGAFRSEIASWLGEADLRR